MTQQTRGFLVGKSGSAHEDVDGAASQRDHTRAAALPALVTPPQLRRQLRDAL